MEMSGMKIIMRLIRFLKTVVLTLVCVTSPIVLPSSIAGVINANGGNTFVLTPANTPGVFTDAGDGLAQISLLGNCIFHAEQQVTFPATNLAFIRTSIFVSFRI